MIYPLLIILSIVLVTILISAFHKPHLFISTSSFSFTRNTFGVSIFCYAISLISQHCMPWDAEGWLILAVIMQTIAWIFIIISIRGLFEVLASDTFHKKN